MRISVLTATLPERADMLAEARHSVAAQTFADLEHLIGVDTERQGAGAVLNVLLDEALGDWVMVLDDDDLLDPGHLDVMAAHADEGDVIYSLPRVEGGRFTNYDHTFDGRLLARGFNCVSHTALMRTDLVRSVDGWRNVRAFDLDLFQRLDQAGAEFTQVPEITWTYRLHGANWSQGTLVNGAAL